MLIKNNFIKLKRTKQRSAGEPNEFSFPSDDGWTEKKNNHIPHFGRLQIFFVEYVRVYVCEFVWMRKRALNWQLIVRDSR